MAVCSQLPLSSLLSHPYASYDLIREIKCESYTFIKNELSSIFLHAYSSLPLYMMVENTTLRPEYIYFQFFLDIAEDNKMLFLIYEYFVWKRVSPAVDVVFESTILLCTLPQ